MSKILIINPPTIDYRKITRNCDCASESKGNYLLQPFDFLYLTSKIKKTDSILFIDAVADGLSSEKVLDLSESYNPDLIVTAVVDVLWDQDTKFLAQLRKKIPQSKIFVLGDVTIDLFLSAELAAFCDGLIEDSFSVDLSNLALVPKQVLLTEKIAGVKAVKNLKSPTTSKKGSLVYLGTPRHDLFINSAYRWPFARHKKYTSIAISWGCPYKCSYCIDSQFPHYFRAADDVIDELKFIISLGFKEFTFTDKSFGIPKDTVMEVLQFLKALPKRLSWSTYINPKQCDIDLLSEMSQAGCHTIIIGIENKDKGFLKKFNRHVDSEQIESAITNAHSVGLDVCGDFIFGLPGQNINQINDTVQYSLELNLDYASYNIASPLPGSIVRAQAITDGRMTTHDHHYDSVGKGRALSSDMVSAQDLIMLRNFAARKFYLRPIYLFKKLIKVKTLEHFQIQFAEFFELKKIFGL